MCGDHLTRGTDEVSKKAARNQLSRIILTFSQYFLSWGVAFA